MSKFFRSAFTSVVAIAVTSVALSTVAHALPLPRFGYSAVRPPASFTANYDFEGIVALNNCSGSLIQLENGKDSDQALILTNGHCVEGGFIPPGKFLYGKASTRRFKLLDPGAKSAGVVTATQIVYATMTKTDLTVYKLSETYADIRTKYGIRPLMLSSRHASAQAPIEVISGYWQRGYTCGIEMFVTNLKEDKWTWDDSIRYSRPGCETIGGTSGSPVLAAGTRTVIGINNTGNESGEKCTLNNPCEIDEKGNVTYQRGFSYGQQTTWIYSCLNQNNEIDLAVRGCLLPH